MLPAPHESSVTPEPATMQQRASRILSGLLLAVLVILLLEVLFEAFIQIQLAPTHINEDGDRVADLPEWPKTLKNALYLTLVGLALAKVAVDRRWRDFITKADIALVVLAVVLVAAGLVNGSPVSLTGEAVFVYLRGVIVFYAWRALNPTWPRVRPVLWLLGVIVGINAVLAVIEMLFGKPVFELLGWVDMTWANKDRAHGLLDHPNHLGHVLGLAMLGLLAWFLFRLEKVSVRWWALYVLLGLALSATQSRESMIGYLVGGALIWFLRRGRHRTAAIALLIVVACLGAQLGLRQSNRDEWARRLAGVLAALHMGSGDEPDNFCVRGDPGCDEKNAGDAREIRLLFYQQGARLWIDRPVLGYGVGQFGGIVAFKHDPQWYKDPRFGPGGFDLHDFDTAQTQVDSFWLHLTVETGTVGVVAYLAWLALIALPLWRALRPARRRDEDRDQRPDGRRDRIRGPTAKNASPFAAWGLAALLFAVLVAALAPSLEDPLLPPLLFTILGLGWVDLRRRLLPAGAGDAADGAADGVPADAGPADRGPVPDGPAGGGA